MVDFSKKAKELQRAKAKSKLKIRICTFDINRYGGIIANVESRIKAFKKLGHDVDIVMLTYNQSSSESGFRTKLAKLESGQFQNDIDIKSQYGGYEKSEVTGYWRNSYYGWLLPPFTNSIPAFAPNALELWNKAMEGVDLVLWSFMPTKCKEAEGFNDWYKFFDLPKRTKQVFCVHDGYFDIRASWVTCLKEKLLFLDCVHMAAYNAVENISMPRNLNFASRFIPDKLHLTPMVDREVDFFAAHIFKSMKRMDDLLRMTPYLNEGKKKHSMWIAGSGIELYYMMAKEKLKPSYRALVKSDPDLPKEIEKNGVSIWNRAEEFGMEYLGLIGNEEVQEVQKNAKFSIDPSYCKHYAKYNNTNINGFLIEAMLNGSYPIFRDYRGLIKGRGELFDPIFENLRAIVIPWNTTPKQFASYLKEALKMPEKKYLEDIKHNFEMCKEFFDPIKNMSTIIRLAFEGTDELPVGENSKVVEAQSKKVMEEFFGITLPIRWKNV